MLLDDATRKYIYGFGTIYETDESGNLEAVYQSDGLGSDRALTDSSGNTFQSYQYEEFGVPVLNLGASQQPYGYAGEQRDAEPRLQFLRVRYYDPQVGRLMSQ